MLGGLTELEGEPRTPRADVLIAAAGSATSLAVGAVMAVMARVMDAAACCGLWLALIGWFVLSGAAGRVHASMMCIAASSALDAQPARPTSVAIAWILTSSCAPSSGATSRPAR